MKSKKIFLSTIAILAIFSGCSSEEDDKSTAKVSYTDDGFEVVWKHVSKSSTSEESLYLNGKQVALSKVNDNINIPCNVTEYSGSSKTYKCEPDNTSNYSTVTLRDNDDNDIIETQYDDGRVNFRELGNIDIDKTGSVSAGYSGSCYSSSAAQCGYYSQMTTEEYSSMKTSCATGQEWSEYNSCSSISTQNNHIISSRDSYTQRCIADTTNSNAYMDIYHYGLTYTEASQKNDECESHSTWIGSIIGPY